MIFEFEGPGGKRLERVYPIGKAPRIGAVLIFEGVRYTRVPSRIAPPKVERTPHFVSDSLPRAVQRRDGSIYSPYSSDVEPGTLKPRFKSRREIERAVAIDHHRGGDVVYE
jgi:hypothetical protein